ncbi:MAG: hypothetical protein LBR40_04060 [Bacilli bacterium]|jgi:pilin isopeptide linkage protein|nr:hypothetical protein [Bacilli bacterium]
MRKRKILFFSIVSAIAIMLGLSFILPSAKAADYVTDFQLSGGNSTNLVTGSLSTNQPGQPYEVATGADSVFYLNYSISPVPLNPGGEPQLEAGKVAFRLKIPSDCGQSISMNQSSTWGFKEGSATDYNGTPATGDYKYYWYYSTEDLNFILTGQGAFTITDVFENGTTNDGTSCSIEAQLYNFNPATPTAVDDSFSSSFVAQTNQFNWSNVTLGATVNTDDSGQTPGADATTSWTTTRNVSDPVVDVAIPLLNFNLKTSPNPATLPNGGSYAQSITYNETYNVPMGTTDTSCPLVKITDKSQFIDKNGNPINPNWITLNKNSNGLVTSFTINPVITNTSNPASELNPTEFWFGIKGAMVNSSCSDIQNASVNNPVSFKFTTGASTHLVKPMATLDSSVNLTNGNLVINQSNLPNVTLNYVVRLAELPEDSFKKTIKKVTKIGTSDVNQSGMADPTALSAYVGDNVTYELGAEHIKNNNSVPITIKYTETASADFDTSKIRLTSINSGALSIPNIDRKITITYSDGTTIDNSSSDGADGADGSDTTGNNNSRTWIVDSDVNSGKYVTSFTIEFTLPPGAYVNNTGPLANYVVVDSNNIANEGTDFINKVNQTYTITMNGTTTTKDSNDSVNIKYKNVPNNDASLNNFNKTGANLSRPNAHPVSGDVVLFTWELRNNTGSNLNIDDIKDLYSSSALSPYNGTADVPSKYQNANNSLNMLLWTGDPTSTSSATSWPGGEPTITLGAYSNDNIIDVKMADNNPIVVPSGSTYYITMTMKVKDGVGAKSALGDYFNTYYDGIKNGEGLYWWSASTGGLGSDNKYHSNGSVPVNITTPWTSYPYSNDVVTYAIRVVNNTDETWGDDGPITINDAYDKDTSRYDGDTDFPYNSSNLNWTSGGTNNGSCEMCAGLNLNNPFNLGVVTSTENIYVWGVNMETGVGTGANLKTTAANFDESQVSVTNIDETNRTFTVNLGNNKIAPGEQVVLAYTVKVNPNVSATDPVVSNPTDDQTVAGEYDDYDYGTKENEIINNFEVLNNGTTVGTGKDIFQVNPNENVQGVVDLTKGISQDTDGDGTDDVDSTKLKDNEEIKYVVTVSNDHIKADRFFKVQTLIDQLPEHISYKTNSFALKYYKIESTVNSNGTFNIDAGTKTEMALPSGANNYTIDSSDPHKLIVKWANPIELTSSTYSDDTFQKVTTYQYELTYLGVVDTAGIDEGQNTIDQTNTATVFFTNAKSELIAKNGTIGDDSSANVDNNTNTKSTLSAESTVTLLNDSYNYGKIVKTASNANFNIDSIGTGRNYNVAITNTGANDWTISKIVDILAEYEKIDKSSLVIAYPSDTANVDYPDNITAAASDISTANVSNSSATYEKFTYVHDLVIPAGQTVKISYNTIVDKDAVHDVLKASQTSTYDSKANNFAMYMKNNATLNLNGGGMATSDNTSTSDFDGNYDNDNNTGIRYQADLDTNYLDNSLSPAVNIQAKVPQTDGTLLDYSQGVTPINPGDNLAWNIWIGNQTNATAPIFPGAKIILVLPEGVTAATNNDGSTIQYLQSSNYPAAWNSNSIVDNTTKPSWLSDPVVSTVNGKQVIEWTITSSANLPPGASTTGFAGFTINSITKPYTYTSYAPDVYFVPLQNDSMQDFYDSVVTSTGGGVACAWQPWNYMVEESNISNLDASLTGTSHYVKDNIPVDVYGAYGMSAYKSLTYDGNTITSRDSNRVMELANRDDIFTYTLTISSEKADAVLNTPVIVDRLPNIDDTGVTAQYASTDRDSKAPVRLVGDGDFVVDLVDGSGNVTTLDPSQYTIEYMFENNATFTDDDMNGVANASRWYDSDAVQNANKDFNDATAIRVKITDGAVRIAGNGKLNVSFKAHLGLEEDASDYNNPDNIAYNNFGYKIDYGVSLTKIITDVIQVGVKADVPDAQASIVKNIDLNGHTDSASRTNFLNNNSQTFNFTYVGKDASNTVQYSCDFSINANTSNSTGYTGNVITSTDPDCSISSDKKSLIDLDPTLTYTLQENTYANFTTNIASDSTVVDNQTRYTYTVTNTWQPIQIKAEKAWMIGNNAMTSDEIDSILVPLLNGESIPVDLYANDVKIKTGNITATSTTVDFGYFNKYDADGDEINYDVEEGTFNHASFFTINDDVAIVKSGTDNSVYTYGIQNKLTTGGVELTKKDDLNNLLANATFNLYQDNATTDTLIGTYTTNSSGVISVDTLAPGDYYFTETSAPAGYTKDSDNITFSITGSETDAVSVDATNDIIRGSVELTKVSDQSSNTYLQGAVFELYQKADNPYTHNTSDTKIGTSYTTNSEGKILVDNLIPGDYYFKEINAPTGYTIPSANEQIDVTVSLNQTNTAAVTATNNIIKGGVVLTKKDDLDNTLVGAEFELYQENGATDTKIGSTYTTDSSGQITVTDLVPGDYYFTEISAPTGYTMDTDDIAFTVENNPSGNVSVSATNPIILGSVELTKTDDLNNNLAGAEFELYQKANNAYTHNTSDIKIGDTYTTDSDGKILVENLVPGDYYFKEISAPEGYSMAVDTDFTIALNPSQTTPVSISVEDETIKGSVELTKTDDLNNNLAGAEFELYQKAGNTYTHNTSDTKIGDVYTTDGDGKIVVNNLVPGDYYFTEVSAPTGYTKEANDVEFSVAINPSQTTAVSVNVEDPIIKGSIALSKTDEFGNSLENAQFELYLKAGNEYTHNTSDTKIGDTYTSDNDGMIIVDNLIPGDYYFKEVAAPEGYSMVSDTEFSIALNPSTTTPVSISAEDPIIRGSVELTKEDEFNNILADAQFELYQKADNAYTHNTEDTKIGDTYTTDSDGKIVVDNLVPGDYYFKEIAAPTGYNPETNNVEFSVAFNPSTDTPVAIKVIDPIIKGDVELTKMDEKDNLLPNAKFKLCYVSIPTNNALDGTCQDNIYITDDNGKIYVDNLIPGDYYFEEVEAPEGLLMLPNEMNVYNFTIAFNPSETILVNAYNMHPVSYDPPVQKIVAGNDASKAPNTTFTFEMRGLDNAPMPQGSQNGVKQIDAGVGAVEFGDMTFTEAGTYKYILKEVNDAEKNFTYDTSEYTLTIVVTFENDRYLTLTSSIEKDGKAYSDTNIEFTNLYTLPKQAIVDTGSNDLYVFSILVMFTGTLSLVVFNKRH